MVPGLCPPFAGPREGVGITTLAAWPRVKPTSNPRARAATEPAESGKDGQERLRRLREAANARRRAVYSVRGRPGRNRAPPAAPPTSPPPLSSSESESELPQLDDLLDAAISEADELFAASDDEVA
jgi:hypothetical protein